jgi:hypothetical protein
MAPLHRTLKSCILLIAMLSCFLLRRDRGCLTLFVSFILWAMKMIPRFSLSYPSPCSCVLRQLDLLTSGLTTDELRLWSPGFMSGLMLINILLGYFDSPD